MTIQARQMLVPSSKYAIKCPYAMTAKYITFHNTANDASANNEITYMRNNNAEVSYHFAVDDKEVVQGIPVNRNAWHTGDGSGVNSGNRTSIGVEVCYSKSGGERYKKAETLAIKFIAQLLKERGWGVDRVKKHQEWSGKYCPHRVLDEGRWNEVKNKIAAELKALNGKSSTSKTTTKKASSAPSKSTNSGIKSVGKIKIVGVSNAAIIMDKPDRIKAKNVGTIGLGKTIDIAGSVRGSNNSKGYWEIIHNGKRRYVSGQYGKMV
ncbi:N-acetylmuramoyl-L-alanine amidase family protein [Bacillus mojavensis]|uniref:peptidoglycan recognition protein family protein n=1 Tax=Bacillus mojavensis TaxID=72360 RepID=UPI002DB7D711|nr:N-acetylmuramoyl-L-alanine amidase family protein [Bacillus mojavensis]MEC1709822.1 N-acetylmuramoyl-L-alanine amidase family protein [Bacillus mojavensis]